MKIYLVDNANDGHHDIYQKTLKNIPNTVILNKIINFKDVKKDPIKAYKERKNFINYINKETKDGLVHLLYIDSLYKCPFISSRFETNKTYIGTLHWIPKDCFRMFLLKRFSKKMKYIVVHSEFLKEKLEDKGIRNVICIDYPSFIKYDRVEMKEKKNDDKIIISCLGGTRSDKGLDILLKSFDYLNDSCREKLIFNICGIEQDIKYDDILSRANENSINITHKNKFLTDKEYEDEIIKSDVILLPYKKIFTGNSGPMTDGVYANKFILGPNQGNLGYLIDKYNLGSTFRQEDENDLAMELENLITKNLYKEHEYRKRLSVDTFLNSYRKLYKKYQK